MSVFTKSLSISIKRLRGLPRQRLRGRWRVRRCDEQQSRRNSYRRQYQAGSLAGAVHLSNGNAGVLRQAQRRQKRRVEQKGKSLLDLDFQYEYMP